MGGCNFIYFTTVKCTDRLTWSVFSFDRSAWFNFNNTSWKANQYSAESVKSPLMWYTILVVAAIKIIVASQDFILCQAWCNQIRLKPSADHFHPLAFFDLALSKFNDRSAMVQNIHCKCMLRYNYAMLLLLFSWPKSSSILWLIQMTLLWTK